MVDFGNFGRALPGDQTQGCTPRYPGYPVFASRGGAWTTGALHEHFKPKFNSVQERSLRHELSTATYSLCAADDRQSLKGTSWNLEQYTVTHDYTLAFPVPVFDGFQRSRPYLPFPST